MEVILDCATVISQLVGVNWLRIDGLSFDIKCHPCTGFDSTSGC